MFSKSYCRYTNKRTNSNLLSLSLSLSFSTKLSDITNLLGIPNFPSQFSQDDFLPFLATSNNHHCHFDNLFEFPVAHFTYLPYDNLSIDKILELPASVRPYAKRVPQIPSLDGTSDVSLQTAPSSSNVLVNIHNIGNPTPNFDPVPPPSFNNLITTQLPTSHPPHQYNTPPNYPPPTQSSY